MGGVAGLADLLHQTPAGIVHEVTRRVAVEVAEHLVLHTQAQIGQLHVSVGGVEMREQVAAQPRRAERREPWHHPRRIRGSSLSPSG